MYKILIILGLLILPLAVYAEPANVDGTGEHKSAHEIISDIDKKAGELDQRARVNGRRLKNNAKAKLKQFDHRAKNTDNEAKENLRKAREDN